MKKITILFSLFAVVLFACNSSSDSENKESATVDTASQYTAPAMNTDPAAQAQTQQAAPQGMQFTPQGMQSPDMTVSPPQPQAVPAGPTAAGMNPPHGEPGHRCDIAVGAPLNSAPTQPAAKQPTEISMTPPTVASPSTGKQPSFTTMPTPTPITAMPPASSAPSGPTAPGMNPPHGEPGHDCAIPVGQPLKK